MGKKMHVFFQRSFSSIQWFFSEPAALHGVEVESSTAMHVFFLPGAWKICLGVSPRIGYQVVFVLTKACVQLVFFGRSGSKNARPCDCPACTL